MACLSCVPKEVPPTMVNGSDPEHEEVGEDIPIETQENISEVERPNLPPPMKTGPLIITAYRPYSYRIEGDTKKYRSHLKDLGAVFNAYNKVWYFGSRNPEMLEKKLTGIRDFVEQANAGKVEPTPDDWKLVGRNNRVVDAHGPHAFRGPTFHTPRSRSRPVMEPTRAVLSNKYQGVMCYVPRPQPGMLGYIPSRNVQKTFTVTGVQSTGTIGPDIIDVASIQLDNGKHTVANLSDGRWVTLEGNNVSLVFFNI